MKREFSATCMTCKDNPEIGRAHLEPVEVMPWLLNLHADRPHTNHQLAVEVGGAENLFETEGHDIEIKCTRCYGGPQCHGAYRKHRAPMVLVGALVLMLHTRHEGHPLELTIDGRKIAD